MPQPRKVILLSVHDPLDRRSWSGTNYFIYRALKAVAGELTVVSGFKGAHTFGLKLRATLSRMLGFHFNPDLSSARAKYYAAQISDRVTDKDAIIFTMNGHLLPYIDVPNKVVLYNDATFANQYGYYEFFSHFNPYDKWQAFRNENRALQRADVLIFASDWAAQSARKDYRVPEQKIHVVPFGANFSFYPPAADIQQRIAERDLSTLNLLFVGVDYERKGGDMAVAVATRLHQMGIAVTLTMVGIKHLAEKKLPGFVIDAGMIYKDEPGGEERLQDLYRAADFFILPSVKECYGVVFAEACAFGLPILAIDTGGVPTIVTHGENGWLFPKEQAIDGFTGILVDLSANVNQYREHCRYARLAFEEKLNWETVSKKLEAILWPAA